MTDRFEQGGSRVKGVRMFTCSVLMFEDLSLGHPLMNPSSVNENPKQHVYRYVPVCSTVYTCCRYQIISYIHSHSGFVSTSNILVEFLYITSEGNWQIRLCRVGLNSVDSSSLAWANITNSSVFESILR